MRLYDQEEWYLQLDSHHRFGEGWDDKLTRQVELTGSEKPILTTYAAAFSPQRPADAVEQTTRIEFGSFTREGVILTAPGLVVNPSSTPARARFLSAHFLFAPGSFVADVPYDPELYFIGEEITLAVRAFTHGYDLFHPSEHILWHEYTRAQRRRHWDDHTSEHGAEIAWHVRDAASLDKIARLLADPHSGRDAFGTARSFADYEAYAGVSFRHRRVQDHTRLGREPPNPSIGPDWPTRVQDHKIEMRVDVRSLTPAALEDPTFWYVGVHDAEGSEIFRADADRAELSELATGESTSIAIVREFESEAQPASWTILPHSDSKGWLAGATRRVERESLIFVSIAAYRDPELVPTIEDCLAKARHPERIVFGICWQHSSGEALPDWITGPQFRVRDVDSCDSRGPCWARAELMKLWDGEQWYLQLDSHHRFAEDWDETLIRQSALTGSKQPVLSAPAAPFTIGQPLVHDGPWRMEFAGFRADGIPAMRIGRLPGQVVGRPPVRARWLCGHLLFAPGSFVEDVPYDSEMYFSVEETTMAVRAFTHGYDLFHPTEIIAWHEYTRAYRTKHWDDHAAGEDVERPWHELRDRSLRKVARFFAEPELGPCALGSVRTLADYEAYAGVDFAQRRVQDYTLLQEEPPNPAARPDWQKRVRERHVAMRIDRETLPRSALEDATFWYVGVHDRDGRELYRRDASPGELQALATDARGRMTLVRDFCSERPPASWTVLPHCASTGWLEPITGAIKKGALPGRSGPRLRVLASESDAAYHRVIYDTLRGSIAEAHLPSTMSGNGHSLRALLSRYEVFHLHWPELLLGADDKAHDALIDALEDARTTVVWTQHNLLPHHGDPRAEGVYERWAKVARGVIHHSRWGKKQATARYRFRSDAVHRVIPHPNFGPLVKRDPRSRREIEASLGLRHDVTRLAVVGAPRRERDAALAMRAASACRRADIELVVYSLRPGETAPHDERIVAHPYEKVSRAEYDRRLQVTDALVMPFQPGEMLTTGTVGDAIAHGLPCLVSEWPFLQEALAGAGIPYGQSADDLAATIDALTQQRLAAARAASVSRRAGSDPRRVGRMTLGLLGAARKAGAQGSSPRTTERRGPATRQRAHA
jgi:hypothetical protein